MGASLVLTVAPPDLDSLVLVLAASTLAALLSRVHRTIILPTVVVEIVLGILIGPEVLGWAEVDAYISFLENFGLAFLFFFAGLEVVEKRVPAADARARHARLGGLARPRLRVGFALACRRRRRGVVAARRRACDDRARDARADPRPTPG